VGPCAIKNFAPTPGSRVAGTRPWTMRRSVLPNNTNITNNILLLFNNVAGTRPWTMRRSVLTNKTNLTNNNNTSFNSNANIANNN